MRDASKRIPKFKTEEEEEREFWATHDFTEFAGSTEEVKVPVIDARPSKAHISFRLDADAIRDLKSLARGKGMGYQTLMRSWIMERLEEEKKKAG